MQIQSSAVITRSYLLRYHIRHCDNNGRYYIYIYVMNQILDSQQTPHISPSQASYGVSIVRILEKIDSVITAPRCI